MAKTLDQIQRQIDKLQQEASALRQKEISAVVARIREAIDHYGLTLADLGFNGKSSKTEKPIAAAKRAKMRSSRPVKYRDAQGNQWVGHGKRPKWFVDAIASGKTPDDLRV